MDFLSILRICDVIQEPSKIKDNNLFVSGLVKDNKHGIFLKDVYSYTMYKDFQYSFIRKMHVREDCLSISGFHLYMIYLNSRELCDSKHCFVEIY